MLKLDENERINGRFATKHGKHGTRLYKIWDGIKQRCFNPHDAAYKNYGARGIAVHHDWAGDFPAFERWAYKNGYSDELTIDRMNVNGNYEPDNCRWITRKEQNRNRRDNKRFTFMGSELTLGEISEITGVSQYTLWARINESRYQGHDLFTSENLVKKKVIRDDGIIYESCTEAANANGLKSRTSIANVCRGKYKTTNGHAYSFL